MAENGDGRVGGLVEAFKTILSSPVGGWVIAIGVVAYMGWFTMQDRQKIYEDMMHLRETAMPVILEARTLEKENQALIKEAQAVTEDNNKVLYEIRSFMNLPLENRSDVKEILRRLKKQPEEQNGPGTVREDLQGR